MTYHVNELEYYLAQKESFSGLLFVVSGPRGAWNRLDYQFTFTLCLGCSCPGGWLGQALIMDQGPFSDCLQCFPQPAVTSHPHPQRSACNHTFPTNILHSLPPVFLFILTWWGKLSSLFLKFTSLKTLLSKGSGLTQFVCKWKLNNIKFLYLSP